MAAYWGYTLGGLDPLAPLLGRPRQIAVGAGTGLALLGLGLDGGLPTGLAFAVPALALAAYSVRNQWLLPRSAPVFGVGAAGLPPDDLVVVLPSGDALSVRWAARLRTVRCGDALVVHCGLARSLTVYAAPDGPPLAAVLPHRAGFDVGSERGRWDGVDGAARDGGRPLERLPSTLCSHRRWTERWPDRGLYGPPTAEPAPPPLERTPRVPGARGVQDAMRWGRVDGDVWTPLREGDRDPRSPADYHLARWAAQSRGLVVK